MVNQKTKITINLNDRTSVLYALQGGVQECYIDLNGLTSGERELLEINYGHGNGEYILTGIYGEGLTENACRAVIEGNSSAFCTEVKRVIEFVEGKKERKRIDENKKIDETLDKIESLYSFSITEALPWVDTNPVYNHSRTGECKIAWENLKKFRESIKMEIKNQVEKHVDAIRESVISDERQKYSGPVYRRDKGRFVKI